MAERNDVERLAVWMDAEGLGGGPIREIRQLAGGGQPRLILLRCEERSFVIRRPPNRERTFDRDRVVREGRILTALGRTNIPHPRLLGAYDGAPVLGGTFNFMELVDGFNPMMGLPELHRGSPEIRREMGLAAVEALAALGNLDPGPLGLAQFGGIESPTGDRLLRFREMLMSYADFPGAWPGPAGMGDVERVVAWLEAHLPPVAREGIVHGDYYLGNLMYRHDGSALAAIVDWELATVGDPLADLGMLVATWPDADGIVRISVSPKPGEPERLAITPWDGFPSAEELIDHYARHSDRDLAPIRWHIVFACFRLAVILEEINARVSGRPGLAAAGERAHARVRWLIARAERWIDS